MRQLIHNFLNSISTDILEKIYWYDDESVHDSDIEKIRIGNNSSSDCSKSSSMPPDNPPILQSKITNLNSNNSNTSTLKGKPLNIIYLKDYCPKVFLL